MVLPRPTGNPWRWLRYWVWTLLDALPPYRKVEGLLDTKDMDSDGKYYVSVGLTRVEVDHSTFETLVAGESLRVRYTRGHRAISIDRLTPGSGPG